MGCPMPWWPLPPPPSVLNCKEDVRETGGNDRSGQPAAAAAPRCAAAGGGGGTGEGGGNVHDDTGTAVPLISEWQELVGECRGGRAMESGVGG